MNQEDSERLVIFLSVYFSVRRLSFGRDPLQFSLSSGEVSTFGSFNSWPSTK
jgi:hypothetical protein